MICIISVICLLLAGDFVFSWDCLPNAPSDSIVFNRVPKTGSAAVLKWINSKRKSAPNQFHYSQAGNPIERYLSEKTLDKYITGLNELPQPFLFQRHVYWEPLPYPNFKYVSISRDPVARCISRYNYEAFLKKRIPAISLDECIRTKKCQFEKWTLSEEQHSYPTDEINTMQLVHDECNNYMTRWFCGRGPECRTGNLEEALQLAMKNIRKEYQTILVHDDLPGSLFILSKLFPSFFGVSNTTSDFSLPTVHPSTQPPPSPQTIALLESLNIYDKKLHTFILGLHRLQLKRCNDDFNLDM